MLNHFGSGTTKKNAKSIKGADGEGFWPELDFHMLKRTIQLEIEAIKMNPLPLLNFNS